MDAVRTCSVLAWRCSSNTCWLWCSSWKTPHGAGLGSQETTAVEWLASSGCSLLHTIIWQLFMPAQQRLQNPSPMGGHEAGECTQWGGLGEKQMWVWGQVLLPEVKEMQRDGLGRNGHLPDAGCSKAFGAYSYPSPSLHDLSILTSIWTSHHLCAGKNNHASSRLPQRAHVSSTKRKTTAFK